MLSALGPAAASASEAAGGAAQAAVQGGSAGLMPTAESLGSLASGGAEAAGGGAGMSGVWDTMKGFIGEHATNFVKSMGDTPEERQKNVETFATVLKTINGLGAQVGQSTLAQRLGQQKAKEVIQQQGSVQNMQPLPPMSPEMIQGMLDSVGYGAQDVRNATRWGGR